MPLRIMWMFSALAGRECACRTRKSLKIVDFSTSSFLCPPFVSSKAASTASCAFNASHGNEYASPLATAWQASEFRLLPFPKGIFTPPLPLKPCMVMNVHNNQKSPQENPSNTFLSHSHYPLISRFPFEKSPSRTQHTANNQKKTGTPST